MRIIVLAALSFFLLEQTLRSQEIADCSFDMRPDPNGGRMQIAVEEAYGVSPKTLACRSGWAYVLVQCYADDTPPQKIFESGTVRCEAIESRNRFFGGRSDRADGEGGGNGGGGPGGGGNDGSGGGARD